MPSPGAGPGQHRAPDSGIDGDPHADWPDRTTISDEAGLLTLVFSASQSSRDATPWADGVWVPPTVPTTRAVALALASLPGWIVSTADRALATALLVAGASERRHAHSMTTSLTEPVSAAVQAPDVRVEPLSAAQLDRHALSLAEISRRASLAGRAGSVAIDEALAVSELRAVGRGEILGPMIPESRIALADGAIVGACLVVDRPGIPPHGGPWIVDIFRDPDSEIRGIGTALLTRVMAAGREAGLPGLSLVVTHDNERAHRLYRHLGFVDVQESWTLTLPLLNHAAATTLEPG